jgi:hypothetical protein
MKALLVLITIFNCLVTDAVPRTYVGSTPAHDVIRKFLGISLTDSIDFIRWKLEVRQRSFKLQCEYGLGKPGTPGFWNEKNVSFEGELSKTKNIYLLKSKGREVSMREVNVNILHFIDRNDHMLIGNGGYSYALNSTAKVKAEVEVEVEVEAKVEVKVEAKVKVEVEAKIKTPLVFEGRTPCQELSVQLGLNKGEACNKMKWYFLFYTDSVTGRPSYFLMAGIGYRKESMKKGRWEIVTEPNGDIIYRLYSDIWTRPLILLQGDDNILFFMDADGRLLVGNENFSYTLNRKEKEYPPIDR